ncbi:MAG: metal-dependent hydrolase [Acidimicrobiia bacterium]
MILWHAGATLWLFRWIFKDPKVDVRFLLAGAILPDLIDLTIGGVLFADVYARGELWSHTLIAPSLYMVAVLLVTRRGRRRRAFMAVGIGWLFHLLLDGMWTDPQIFLWPFFGWDFPVGSMPFWQMAWERAISDPWRWIEEAVGLGYLLWLWRATGLGQRERRAALVRTGRLPELLHDDA